MTPPERLARLSVAIDALIAEHTPATAGEAREALAALQADVRREWKRSVRSQAQVARDAFYRGRGR